eukprot:365657-Chlamydomonas_euryale.AAC.4
MAPMRMTPCKWPCKWVPGCMSMQSRSCVRKHVAPPRPPPPPWRRGSAAAATSRRTPLQMPRTSPLPGLPLQVRGPDRAAATTAAAAATAADANASAAAAWGLPFASVGAKPPPR